MAKYALTGDDVLIIDQLVGVDLPNDLANGTIAELTIPNDIVALAVGKNGNAIYAKDESGRQFELALRVIKGTETDKQLISRFTIVNNNFAGATLLTGNLTKNLGDGYGQIIKFSVSFSGGMIRKYPENSTNVNGDIEQAISVYNIIGVIDSMTVKQ